MDFIAIIFIDIILFAAPAYVWGVAIIGVGAMRDNIPEADNKRGWLKNIFICVGIVITIILAILLFVFIVEVAGTDEKIFNNPLGVMAPLGGLIPLPWLAYKGCRQAIRERIKQAGYSSYHLLCFSLGILFIILFTICIVLAIAISTPICTHYCFNQPIVKAVKNKERHRTEESRDRQAPDWL